MPRSTVEQVLARYRMPLLANIDQATGLPVRRSKPVRYEHAAPGDLVHVDIEKQSRIRDGGGHRMLGRAIGRAHGRGHTGSKGGRGYSFLNHAIEDHSRLAYSEILADVKKETATGFWKRANAFFTDHDITVKRVITDNGSCYRSKLFNDTLADEWAYAQTYLSDEARAATYQAWVHDYNHHRPHNRIGGKSPIERVHNVPGNGEPFPPELLAKLAEHRWPRNYYV